MTIDSSRKSLKDGALPTLFLPEKSVQTKKSEQRNIEAIRKRNVVSSEPPVVQRKVYYNNLDDVEIAISCLKAQSWEFTISPKSVKICKHHKTYILPMFEIFIDSSLSFTVRVNGWLLPDDHLIYKENLRSVRHLTLSRLMLLLEGHGICQGIEQLSMHFSSTVKHVLPKHFDMFSNEEGVRLCQDEVKRSINCELLMTDNDRNMCLFCEQQTKCEVRKERAKEASLIPAKLNAPVTVTNPKRLKLTMQQLRKENADLKTEIESVKQELEKASVPVQKHLDKDLQDIFNQCDKRRISPFMKLFWEEQMKYLQSSPSQARYHPMVIKFCLGLYAKSPAAYQHLRYNEKEGTGVLVLPSQRTLRDYRNYIRPNRGFNTETIKDLSEKTKSFTPEERYVVISFDEMKVQEDLVWDKNTNELIGFVDLGDIDLNYAALKKVDDIATHVLVFLIRSVVNPLSYSFATFATTGVNSSQLFLIFWRAVAILEMTCNLKVIATVSDGASQNRAFYRMHIAFTDDAGKDVVYRAVNLYASEQRFIWFFCDAPHLIKTARNCLANSGAGRNSRLMWNDGAFILWNHISKLYYEDVNCGLRLLPGLTNDHINLTSYSVMRVGLAAQVLSSTVSSVLQNYGGPECQQTAKFCMMMDHFFDCLNVRNTTEHTLKRKEFLKPYSSVEDERFLWLQEDFLGYLANWKSSVENRVGNFDAVAKAKMFVSWQTYEGLQITCHALVECTKYLLNKGVKYILTENFNQDDLENYFGRQRAIGSRRDNPSVRDVGYNDNVIKSQFSVAPLGNVKAVNKWNNIEETPLPKRKKT